MKKAVENNPESYSTSNISGRVKIYEYNGFKLKGTWELEVAKWLDLNNIKWTNKLQKGFKYFWDGYWHLYFPDFYLEELDFYIEVKGYKRDRDIEKWKYFPYKLIIIRSKEFKEIQKGTFTLWDV